MEGKSLEPFECSDFELSVPKIDLSKFNLVDSVENLDLSGSKRSEPAVFMEDLEEVDTISDSPVSARLLEEEEEMPRKGKKTQTASTSLIQSGDGQSAEDMAMEMDENAAAITPNIVNGDILESILVSIGELPAKETRMYRPKVSPLLEPFFPKMDKKFLTKALLAHNSPALKETSIIKVETDDMEKGGQATRPKRTPPAKRAEESVPDGKFAKPILDPSRRRGRPKKKMKCPYCGSNVRALDRHREDGRFSLECRSIQCLRFIELTDDRQLIEMVNYEPLTPHGWYNQNPMRMCYEIRPRDEPRRPPREPLPRTSRGQPPIMIPCPGQQRLVRLL